MFVLELRRGEETRSFSLKDGGPTGWELSELANRQPVRTVHYQDWHRVELAITILRLQAASLEREGWHASFEPSH